MLPFPSLLIGLFIAGCWGLADIQSSHVTINATRSTVIAQGSGMAVLVIAGIVCPLGGSSLELDIHALPTTLEMLIGLGGISALGYFSLYRAFQSKLAVGLVSVLVASNGAVSTLLSWMVFHDANLESVLCILCGVLLMASKATASSNERSARDRHSLSALLHTPPVLQGVYWALVAAICLGGFNFGLGLASSVTHAWYIFLLGSRVFSLVLLSLVFAGTTRKEPVVDRVSWQKNILLSVGVGVTEMMGLIFLSFSVQMPTLHLTMLTALASCSTLLPFGYSIIQGMRLTIGHGVSLMVILFGLMTISSPLLPSPVVPVLLLGMGGCLIVPRLSPIDEQFGSRLTAWLASLSFPNGLFWSSPAALAFSSLKNPVRLQRHPLLYATSLQSVIDVPQKEQAAEMSAVGSVSQSTPPLGTEPGRDRRNTPDRNEATTLSPTPAAPRSQSPQTRLFSLGKQRRLIVSLCMLLIALSALLFPVLLSAQPVLSHANGLPSLVGTLTFTSSGQVDATNTTGINDGVALSLHALPHPSAGTSYYVWLLPDQHDDEAQPLLVETLPGVGPGNKCLSFTSPTHQNLLSQFSGILVTQQATNPAPLIPSTNHDEWRYEGLIANTPNPDDPKHYSLLDHLRHLLANDPTLADNGLAGGLDIWLYRNAEKILEWSTAARDGWTGNQSQQSDLLHRHMLRILDYLDGITYVSRDVPQGSPFLADTHAGHFGLLDLFPAQDPPGLLSHVALHVQGLINAPGHTPEQLQLAQTLMTALDTIAHHLQNVRADAQKLVLMNNTQLEQQTALNLMNDMVTNAMSAYVGEPDATTGANVGGVAWVHTQMQHLAVVPVIGVNA